jgi:aminoglycoside phosphotransferase (APT) family kinase protein
MTDTSPFDGIDTAILSGWMDEQGLPGGPIERATRLGGGTQNILVRFERGGEAYVLRRPPLHKRRNSDETMRREARFLAALEGSDVPHPRLIAACPDESLLGAAFYLMEPIDGFNPTTGLPALHASDPRIRHRMGLSMVDGIAALGCVDHVAVGVADLGNAEGFLARQVPRWQAHLESYASFEGYAGPEIPGLDRVAAWLEAHRPPQNPPGILHGDFHVANVLFEPDGPELAAIVDWELCTIGDPLLDLGWMLATWPDGSPGATGGMRIEPWDGFPDARELVARYGERSPRSVDAAPWFEVLACFKLGIILEGTHARACAGKAPKPVGDLLHATTLGLFERALRRIAAA